MSESTPIPENPSAHETYLLRRSTLTSEEHNLRSHRKRLRLALLVCFAVAAYLLDQALHGALPLRDLLFPILLSVALAPFYLRSQTRLTRALRLQVFYDRSLARVDGLEPQSGHLGEEFRDPSHLYDRDLNILGHMSLFSLLATTRTGVGQRGLARILLAPATREQTLARQQAVQELTPLLDLREQLALLGTSSFQQVHGVFFDAWLDTPPPTFHPAVRIILVITSPLLLGLLLAALFHLLPRETALLNAAAVAALQSAVALSVRRRVLPILGDTRVASQTQMFSDGLALLQRQTFTSPLLQALQNAATSPIDAVPSLRRIQNQFVIIEQRPKEYFFVLSLLLAAGTHAAISIAQWKRADAAAMKLWLDAFAEFEALNALAIYAFEHPANTYPEILPPEIPPTFEATALSHPLLPSNLAVPNDIHLNPTTRFYLISGSNMAGKSTLLRTIGTAAVLAQAGAPIPSPQARLSTFTLAASISIADSLADGKSKFLAEVERLHATLQSATAPHPSQPLSSFAAGGGLASATHPYPVISTEGEAAAERPASPTDPSPHPPPVLFLIDEIFSGTNSADRLTAAAAVLRQLIAAGALGALSTHDLTLTTLADPNSPNASPNGQNVHMASPDPENPLAFDYTLKPGINPSTNALAILRLIGIEP